MPESTTQSLIFLSYSRNDSMFASELAQKLQSAGMNVWLDKPDIGIGQRWDQAIEKALLASKCLVVILSPAAVSSQNVLDEVSYALEEGKKVIPVLYQECSIPFRLRRLQFADFTKTNDVGLEQLLNALSERQEDSGVKPQQTSPSNAQSFNDSIFKTFLSKNRNTLLAGIVALLQIFLGYCLLQPWKREGREQLFLGYCVFPAFSTAVAILITGRNGKSLVYAIYGAVGTILGLFIYLAILNPWMLNSPIFFIIFTIQWGSYGLLMGAIIGKIIFRLKQRRRLSA